MKLKNMSSLALVLILMSCVIITGCNSKQTASKGGAGQPVALGTLPLCPDCGQIKGSADCCKPDQVLCSKCGLAKGSPGCCQMTKGTTNPVALCTMCGQIAGSASCCKPGQTLCPKCGLVKGSPGCCKIK